MKYARNISFMKGFVHKTNFRIHGGFQVVTYEETSHAQ